MNKRIIACFCLLSMLACELQSQQRMVVLEETRSESGEAGLSVVIDQSSPVIGCGEPVTLTATITGAVEISWKRNGEFITGATTNTFVANQSGIYSVVVVSLLCQVESDPVEVILQSPLNALIVSSQGTEACQGQSILLQATGGTAQWQWYRDGTALIDGVNATFTATEAGSYVVVGNESSPCASESQPVEVIIYALPQVSLVWEGDPLICEGDSLMVAASYYDNLTFDWYRDESLVILATSSFSATVAGEYHAIITDSITGCSNSTNSITLNVIPAQQVEISIDGNPWICAGASSLLVVTAGEGQVQWFADGASMEGMTDLFLNVYDSSGYSARITDSNGCTNESNSLSVDIFPLPNAEILLADGIQNLCGAEDTLLLHVDEGNAYVWFNGEVELEGQQNSSLEVMMAGDYTVQVTNSDGCTAVSDVLTIAMIDLPEVLLIPEDGATICSGQSIVLEVISAQAIAYDWYLNGAYLPGSTAFSLEVSTQGDYAVQVTDEFGCSALSATTTVQTIEVETPVITDGGITPEGQLLQTSEASGHQWYWNGEMIFGATGSSYVATQDGIYTCIALEDICESQVSAGFEVVLGEVNEGAFSFRVYPNPANDYTVLELGNLINVEYRLIDVAGRVVFISKANNTHTVLQLGEMSPGMYRLVLDNGEKRMLSVVR